MKGHQWHKTRSSTNHLLDNIVLQNNRKVCNSPSEAILSNFNYRQDTTQQLVSL